MCAWTKKGTIRPIKIEGKRSKKVKVIAAKSQNQIIAPFLFEGSCNACVFETYTQKVLCPSLRKGQVVIMDNATFHKSKKIRELIEEKECTLIYLPPYSPERHPIEHYWSVLKKKVKHCRRFMEDVYDVITLALNETQELEQP
jgi:transposase